MPNAYATFDIANAITMHERDVKSETNNKVTSNQTK